MRLHYKLIYFENQDRENSDQEQKQTYESLEQCWEEVISETAIKTIQKVAKLHAKLVNNDDGEGIIAIIFYLNIIAQKKLNFSFVSLYTT